MTKHVLIVDDSRTEALKARLILERAGYQVSLAADGQTGVQAAARVRPDVILLDTIMPQLNGFEACGRLKLDPLTCQIPIVMMPTPEEAAQMPSGGDLPNFLIKPYDPAALLARVNDAAHGNGHGPAAEAEQLHRQLQDTRQARSDFLANMSHELRTPLHEIIGMTDLLTGTPLTTEQAGYLETTRRASGALLSLVSDVIEFTELEAGQLELRAKEFDLNEPLRRMTELMKPRAIDKGLNLSTSISAQVPRRLVGDANRLRQVLDQLVGNAIKFTERGDVAVRVDLESAGGSRAELHFRVIDTGIGLAADRHEIVFQPFQQADASATRRFGGLGMGLALAKQLVTLMGGRLWVESEPGLGSTFHIIVTLEVAAQHMPTAAAAPDWPRPLSILVAEDSPTNQLIARSSLKKAGHRVMIAPNGLEAVRAFEQARADHRPFELILMDVSMPEMDGLEATQRIRQIEQAQGGRIPIVAMTAFATKEYHDKCLAAGMDAYVTKPVRVEELHKALEPLMAGTAAAVSAVQLEAEAPVNLREALAVVGDDVDLLREAAAMSLDEVAGELAALQAAVLGHDAQGVEAKAHRLKGIMGTLGGLAAHAAGQRLETMGEQKDLSGTADVLAAFQFEIERVVNFYRDPAWECAAWQLAGGE